MRLAALAGGIALALSACAGPEQADPECTGAKCDLPDDPAELSCERGRTQALNDNQRAFTSDALRWSCADVPGVTGDDRGQEYCEYFAMVSLPDEQEPRILGKNLGIDSWDGTTPTRLALTDDHIAQLEQDDSAVVGQCIFTSWNSDIDAPANGTLMGVPVDAGTFRMTFEANSAEAAQLLVEDCSTTANNGDPADPSDPRHDAYYRGCMLNEQLNETAFRKSDSTACVAAMRLAECGCTSKSGADLAVAMSPYTRRGFPLGSWADAASLPPSCRYVDLGDGSRTVVSCDLTAADVLNYSIDPKARCADKYADNVVVHVPVPSADIECAPNQTSAYTDTCDAQPWVL